MSKRRVFSTNHNTNYNDYNKNLNGVVTLKTCKYNDPNTVLNRYVNYNQLFTLSEAYYNYLNLNESDLYATQNIYNSNISYIDKKDDSDENIMYPTKNKTLFCKTCKVDVISHLPCHQPYMYPYSFYADKKKIVPYIPYKLCLDKWCNNRPGPVHNKLFDIKCNDDDRICRSSCSSGVCKKTRPLFI